MPKSRRSKTRIANLPFVFVNMAMTADGKIATANRKISSFSSRRDLDHLLELRATADAVMCGARTIDLNDVDLSPGPERYRRLRIRRSLAEYPLRIIVSGSGTLDPAASIFRHQFSPILILTTQRASEKRLAALRNRTDEIRVCGDRVINFPSTLEWLRTEWGVKRLLCEGGGELNAALFRAGLVHQLHLTICPEIFGGNWAPTIADGPNATALADAAQLELTSRVRHGDELFLVYNVDTKRVHEKRIAYARTKLS